MFEGQQRNIFCGENTQNAALFNLGALSTEYDPNWSAALLLTSQEISLSIGEVPRDYSEYEFGPVIQQFLGDPTNIEYGRETVRNISDELLPYYKQAVEKLVNTHTRQQLT